ncbi:MAG: helix-turn-helix domain-containing protein, partial [Candidatus Thorarchaeota archaeon]
MTLAELLMDPVRARIYLEVLLNDEVTAQQLKEKIDISRSTMSHHLSRFVEDKVFKVRVKETGRPVKFYSRNPDFKEEVIIDGKDCNALNERIAFLGMASAHLNVISNLLQERAERVHETKSKSAGKSSVAFTFTFMSKEESKIW